MAYEQSLVEVRALPTISSKGTPFELFRQQGIVVKGWSRWSDHLDVRVEHLDILVSGQIIGFWRPGINKGGFKLDEPGFWEINGEPHRSYDISAVQIENAG